MLKNFTIFIGKRILPKRIIKKIQKNFIILLKNQLQNGTEIFCTSGAIGFETAAATAVIRLRRKKRYRHIQLVLLDFGHDQGLYWNQRSRRTYEKIRQKADRIVPVPGGDAESDLDLYKRVLEKADAGACQVCCLPDRRDGTAELVKLARQKGCRILDIREGKGKNGL